MALHTVVILDAGLIFKARPTPLIVQPGDMVKFSNYAGGTVSLTFEPGLFEKDQVSLGGTSNSKDTVTVRDLPDGRYPYRGWVGAIPVLGDSSPEIIIDR